MSVNIRHLGIAVATMAMLCGSFLLPPSANAENASNRTSVAFMARSHLRLGTHLAFPDAAYFGWGYGPSIDWYLAAGYYGPYSYYWDEDCPLRPRVFVNRRGHRIVKYVRVCYWR